MRYASLLVALLLLSACDTRSGQTDTELGAALGGEAAAGFARAIEPRRFEFPADHRAHRDFRNEWWYITGNLQDETGQHFGYQVTLFRTSLSPKPPQSPSQWATNQVWMAHVALTEVNAGRHRHAQRLARGTLGLAGQRDAPFEVWLEDWTITAADDGAFPWVIQAATPQFAFELTLTPHKPVVLQGEAGLSQKSSEPGNASYYYSLTRLGTEGRIKTQDRWQAVRGLSWLDREWSTSALAADQVGWDWFALQLKDGYDLMFYRLRTQDGRADPHSKGAWVNPQGDKQTLNVSDVELRVMRHWEADNGDRYPVQWWMRLPDIGREFIIEALVDDQLMDTGFVYWEGAVRVTEPATNRGAGRVLGYGYLEMTGY